MPKLTAISGVGGKHPAAFMVEVNGFRLLLDLGMGPESGILPDIQNVSPPDAIYLSHAHEDHCGGLVLRSQWGNPPVYTTAMVWQQIPTTVVAETDRHTLPEHGHGHIGPLNVITGRSGHSPGGIWLHLNESTGMTYTGDWSTESNVFPFDLPPQAALLITDATYGDRTQSLPEQKSVLLQQAREGAVIAVPAWGRAPEIALYLMESGIMPRFCPQIIREITLQLPKLSGYVKDRLSTLLTQQTTQPYQPDDVIICCDATAKSGLSAELSQQTETFRFIFGSYIARGTPALAMLQAEKARWLPWNVHPRLQDQLMLAKTTNASQILPAFVAPYNASQIEERLSGRITWEKECEF
ncbi:MBL fold metallo-hydrolase [Brenneria uluponensis]|uniref:MBL fold metallo-hydrolase n=1 Tax=Brenneria uluponensis TaxID=3057057 RepID=UPI0028E51ECF|nr:MBL fold metallo-hydrolase [Brenneria ulupoensis]